MTKGALLFEICANGVESCLAAQEAGADRVELCAGIPEGGTTPSYGEIKQARSLLTTTRLHVIIRPRGGDFVYTPLEAERMQTDIETAVIIAKMNSLCDPGIIEALYDASAAGVEIHLIIRGICCLRAEVPGLSENIHVRSIVGTFLEHSRIFYFENNGESEYFLGSADWMPRNLDKRVEILFPVEDPVLQKEIRHILDIQLSDTKKAHILMPNGTYEKVDQRGKTPLNAQTYFCKQAIEHAKI